MGATTQRDHVQRLVAACEDLQRRIREVQSGHRVAAEPPLPAAEGAQPQQADTEALLAAAANRLGEAVEALRAEGPPRGSDVRFREVVAAHKGIVWEVDANSIVTHLSGRVKEMLGYEPEELVGKNPAFLVEPESLAAIGEMVSRVRAERGRVEDLEYFARRKDGSRIRIATTAVACFGEDGQYLGARGTHVDVTETYLARQRLDVLIRIHAMHGRRDEEIAGVLSEACADLTDSPLGFFGIVAPDGTEIMARVSSRSAPPHGKGMDQPLRFRLEAPGPWTEPIRTRAPLVLNDFPAAAGKRVLPDGHVPIASYLGVPVVADNRVIAVAGVANKSTPYGEADVVCLRALTETVADFLGARRTADDARASDMRWRTFIDFTADWEYWRTPEGRHVYDSPSCEPMTGYASDEFQADPALVERIVHPEDRALFEAHACQAGTAQAPELHVEFRIVRRDGTLRWIQHVCRPVFEEGVFKGTRVSNRDITGQKAAEVALQASERRKTELVERLNAAEEIATIGGWEWDLVTDSVWWSDETYRFFGISPDDFVPGFSANAEFVHPDDLPEYRHRFERSLRTGEPLEFEVRLVMRDGALKHCVAKGKVVTDESGRPVRFRGTLIDMTRRKQAEEEQERLRAQLTLAQKMESVGRLAGGVAHDFNNMLGVILGHTEMALSQEGLPGHVRDALSEVQRAGRRSADLTRQLLAFARKQTIAPSVLNPNDAITGMLTLLRRLVGEGIQLHWKPDPNVWPVMADRSQLDQVLTNLCANARDAIADVGVITIETGNREFDAEFCARHVDHLPGTWVRIAVIDDGMGMDKATLGHLFEPFFTTKGLGRGTGLGLATVYGIVQQNKGFIVVESAPGAGTTFSVYLPRHGAHQAAALKDVPEAPPPRGTETVLLVEDEPSMLRISKALLQHLGYVVLDAGTPDQAIELSRRYEGEIHVLLTDVVMPQMNGAALARQLVAERPRLRVLFVSGYTGDVIANRDVLAEGVHFLQKPFTMAGVATKIREVLDR